MPDLAGCPPVSWVTMSPRDRKAVFVACLVAVGVCGLVSLAEAGKAGGGSTAQAAAGVGAGAESPTRVPGTPAVPLSVATTVAPVTSVAAGAATTTEEPGLDGDALTS